MKFSTELISFKIQSKLFANDIFIYYIGSNYTPSYSAQLLLKLSSFLIQQSNAFILHMSLPT